MVVALMGQSLVQSVPSLLLLITHGMSISYLKAHIFALEKDNYILYAIFIGLTAAIF